jgi:hypothetical protein
MLLTHHMLFVGYSLSDDNFHRLVHQVRGAVGDASHRPGGPFGTALMSEPARLVEDLWHGDIQIVSSGDARRLAILLDYVGARSAAPAAHVLDDSYQALFSEPELALRDLLREVGALAGGTDNGIRPEVREAVKRALDSLRGA